MAVADTAMALAIGAASKGFRPVSTVDQTTHFLKSVAASDLLADARVVRLGRTMSFGRVNLVSASDYKPVAMVSSAFANAVSGRNKPAQAAVKDLSSHVGLDSALIQTRLTFVLDVPTPVREDRLKGHPGQEQ